MALTLKQVQASQEEFLKTYMKEPYTQYIRACDITKDRASNDYYLRVFVKKRTPKKWRDVNIPKEYKGVRVFCLEGEFKAL